VTSPIEKATKHISPNKLFEAFPEWKDNTIIYVVSVPLVFAPICGVLSNDKENDIINDDNLMVTTKQMDNEGRFFQDQKYDVFKEPYIQELTINDGQSTDKTYNYFDFKCLTQQSDGDTQQNQKKPKIQ